MIKNDFHFVEAKKESVTQWVEHTSDVADKTLYPEAESWYRGDNIPGKPEVFLPYPGGFDNFRDKCKEIAENDYEGFKLTDSVEEIRKENQRSVGT